MKRKTRTVTFVLKSESELYNRRGAAVARVIRLAIKLAMHGMRMSEIPAYQGNTAKAKQFRRDIQTLKRAGVPVYVDDERRYRVDRWFLKRFLPDYVQMENESYAK